MAHSLGHQNFLLLNLTLMDESLRATFFQPNGPITVELHKCRLISTIFIFHCTVVFSFRLNTDQ